MSFDKITEKSSNYNHLENKTVKDLVSIINKEDQSVAKSVSKNLDKIEKLINNIEPRMHKGGRLFYIGAGTSGRLGILDASECPPTFGVSDQIVIGLIAGGDKAIRKSQEFAEDSLEQGWEDLKKYEINSNDSVIGIAASGSTPYVVSTIKKCNQEEILTGCITCNSNSPLSKEAKFPIDVVVGPEVVTGSTRMKSGTAQKMILNIISTTLMIRLGRVKGNKMVDMQLANNKLVDRAEKMLINELKISLDEAKKLLQKHKSVRKSIENFKT
ncbi:MAG: N-acetylmuramic acid 6-phosphate etherase [Flavobacteriaceae bacterium]|nr:N-acetylmuramic acid 6-phosphate etherase [Flavobacteriaceae bacterium]